MAVTWTFTEVPNPKVGRARFNDERGHRGVRGVLSASGTYTSGGDNLPVTFFKEVREARLLAEVVAARTVEDGVTVNGDATIYSASAGFTAADIGRVVTGTGIPADAYIASIPAALAERVVDDGVTATDTSLESEDANFVASDVGRKVSGVGIPANTRIVTVTDENTVVLSNATTATDTDVEVTIHAVAAGEAAELSDTATATDDDEDVELNIGASRPPVNGGYVAVVVPGVPGKVKLFAAATGAEVAGATDITSNSFLVELLGK